MKAYTYTLTPLTPIHVGDGDALEPYEYVIKDGHLYKFDMGTLYQKVSDQNKQIIKDSMLKKFMQLDINNLYNEKYGYTAKIPVSSQVQGLYAKSLESNHQQLAIQSFVHSMDSEYIPSTTLKGVVKSAIKEKELMKTVEITDTLGDLSLIAGQANQYTKLRKRIKKDTTMNLICALGKLQSEYVSSVSGILILDNPDKVTLKDIINANWQKSLITIYAERDFYEEADAKSAVHIYNHLEQYLTNLDKSRFMPIQICTKHHVLFEDKYPMGWGVMEFIE
ncbi:MAG: type III-A CRISPR-associated RAMP protein Csm5 [Epulopiscium sp. Nele67-Bin004]|nr:MAG: type III-A CRISPR-associated RAMP protein Csm5 [Epulopiscium sp. Nele67-Bin004]